MGLLGNIEKFASHRRNVGGRTVLVLTPLGKQKAERFDLPTAQGKIIDALNEGGPHTIGELVNETGMQEGRVKAVAKHLINEGYIRKGNEGE